MVNLYIGISKYLILILMAFFVLLGFIGMADGAGKSRKGAMGLQSTMFYLFNFIAFSVLFMATFEKKYIIFYGIQLIYFIIFRSVFDLVYDEDYNKGLLNNMCMLLSISFIMLSRLAFDKGVKQFAITCFATVIAFFIPQIIRKYTGLPKLTYIYCFAGVAFLAAVLVVGQLSRGAKLAITIAGFSFQPSEFVKILYVFFLAAFLKKNSDFKRVCMSAVFAGIHVIILVLSKDLGSALIFFMVYVVIVYVATGKSRYLLAGIVGFVLAAIMSYILFSHVRVRVQAYMDPWSVIDNEGYQVTQSLFAIGTGGMFGMGLFKGLPNSIPIVEQDFMFSAIAEELGGFFAICLIILCMGCFLYFVKSALKQNDMFYKLIGIGLSISYAVQTILTVGGAIKFIPSTGVTLPLVSYGGSSILCTIIMFAVLQGLFVKANAEKREELLECQEEENE